MEYTSMIDVESAKERFMGNYDFFAKYLYQFPERSLFSELEAHIAAQEVKEAFEAAHTMKGIVANLSLKQIEQELFPIVETLRAGALPEEADWEALVQAYRQTVSGITALQKEGTALF